MSEIIEKSSMLFEKQLITNHRITWSIIVFPSFPCIDTDGYVFLSFLLSFFQKYFEGLEIKKEILSF